jgi:uncharacterized membrane protein
MARDVSPATTSGLQRATGPRRPGQRATGRQLPRQRATGPRRPGQRAPGPQTPRQPVINRPVSVVALTFAVIGLAASAYLTIEHFSSSVTLACPESATINCAKVTTSQWSHIFGIPVAVLGLAYFVAMTALLMPFFWRRAALDPVRVAASGIGVLMVLYLIYIELFRVDAICLWCTAVHICTIALFATIAWKYATAEPPLP